MRSRIRQNCKLLQNAFDIHVQNGFGILWHSGISDDGKRYVLRDAEGKDIPLAAEDVEEIRRSKTSLMPAGVTTALKLQELLDLVAFLRDGAAQARLR